MGRYEEAWPLHEFRQMDSTEAAAWGVKWDGAPKLSIVKWNGEPLQGKSILLAAEQGFGDTIQFVRFAPLLKRLGASRVTVVCAPELLALVEGVEGVDAAVDRRAPLDVAEYDRWCGLMSVPAILGLSLAQIPARVPYIALPRRRVDAWSRRLKAALPGQKLKVGLVWAGSSRLGRVTDAFIAFGDDRKRSLHLNKLLPLLRMPDIAFVSLQLGEPCAQLDELPSDLRPIDMTPHIRDFADTACIVDKLDLVISVDTSVAHLAGALGKPVWILNRLAGDWRWLLDREDSPWYPSARLFTQKTEGDWDEVIGRVVKRLEHLRRGA
ncbi:hypothetical protein [Caballeronia sp. ATUFL_M2_KS44]|uniref:hypothetical protein n=1 Tax=Caballeronia sp. ATUFL_M2_KS44 TaxID=2921767 RepID=UPI002028FB5A|nr:hypothetical protein [Caballeronia sp. ATUFL_M2_KS44]